MVVVVVVRARLLVCWCVECMALTPSVEHVENVLPVTDKVEDPVA